MTKSLLAVSTDSFSWVFRFLQAPHQDCNPADVVIGVIRRNLRVGVLS
jgi:hypothetical protein